ncbi:MAG: TlpA family protein disulfide reductase [Sphingobacteriaceae bacterium]|nr:MAG: TlpA family protein disulfide reductase [Sphingobacteriaceae bacterium]
MNKTLSFISFLCFAAFYNLQAQPKQVLEQSLKKMNALKSIRYQNEYISKNPFSAGDTARGVRKTTLLFDNAGTIKQMSSYNMDINGKLLFKEIYTGDSLYTIELADSLYSASVVNNGKVYCEWNNAKELLNTLITGKKPIIQQKDSIVNKSACFNFLIKTYDTVINNSHHYTHYQLLIDKRTLLPVKIKQTAEGDAEKGGYKLGRIQIYKEDDFSGYLENENIKPGEFEFKRDGFSLQNTAMLSNGEQIPELKVVDLDGKSIPANTFKNKLMLIEFGGTACPANALANPLLNRLHSKYAKSEVLIFGIYCDDTALQIKHYLQTNNLTIPIYTGGKKLKKAFKTVGTPGFYLVNGDGKVLLNSNGYSDTLESEISKLIDKTLR